MNAAALADDEACNAGVRGLEIVWVDSYVSDHRIGHRHNLPPITRVSQNLLIASQRGIEDDFSIAFAISADRKSFKYRTIFKGQETWFLLAIQIRPAFSRVVLDRIHYETLLETLHN